MPFTSGDLFGRYEIVSFLGEGGMGEVYRAHDTKLERSVALKILRGVSPDTPAGSPASADGVARMMREARAAAALNHPNAVAVFDVGAIDGTSFIAMELVFGKTLSEFVGDTRVTLKERLRWLTYAARALAAAHARGLVHRDVKPENIMVRDDGVVKVLDFGIAGRLHTPADALASTAGVTLETHSTEGLFIGTPHYMSPEQMRGETVTEKADVFSWGVVAYELLSGTLPWTSDADGLELVSQILSANPEPLSERVPDLPETVAAIVMQSLAKAPAERPASMEVVLDALAPFADVSTRDRAPMPLLETVSGTHTGPSTPPPGSLRVASVGGASNRWRWVTSGAASLIALVAIALFAGHATLGARRGEPPALSPLSSAPSASSSPAGVSIGESTSPSAEAASAFQIGAQAFRDAADDVAMSALDRATELDPSFAAAYLYRAVAASWPDDAARQAFQRALQLRASLGPRDREILEAFGPWARLTPDLGSLAQRLDAALARHPNDVEIALLLCRTRVTLGDAPGATAACDRALRSDDGLAAAWYFEALAAGVKGDLEGATRAYGECLSRAPNASACLRDLVLLRSNGGVCDAALQNARSLVAAYPGDAGHLVLLAEMLYGAGEPIESVRLALAQASRAATGSARTRLELETGASLDVAEGAFEAAGVKLRALEHETEESTSERDHFDVAYARMQLARETGSPADVARIAGDFLARRAAWTPAPHLDPAIYAWREEYLAGTLARGPFETARAGWVAREEKRAFPSALFGDSEADRWAAAFAGGASSEADAKAALAVMPGEAAAPALLRRDVVWQEEVGHAYFLAEDAAHAVPLLESATRSCEALQHPMAAVQASADLGAALEATGDVAGACAAYQRVLGKWGRAKPRSMTAERARQRVAALKCSL